MSLVPEEGPLLWRPVEKGTPGRVLWTRVRSVNPKVREVKGVDERGIHQRVDELRALLSYSAASF